MLMDIIAKRDASEALVKELQRAQASPSSDDLAASETQEQLKIF
jgi:hypothetical protein